MIISRRRSSIGCKVSRIIKRPLSWYCQCLVQGPWVGSALVSSQSGIQVSFCDVVHGNRKKFLTTWIIWNVAGMVPSSLPWSSTHRLSSFLRRKTNLIFEYLCKWLPQQLMYRGECNCGYMIGQVSTNDQGYHGHLTVQ